MMPIIRSKATVLGIWYPPLPQGFKASAGETGYWLLVTR